MCFSAGASFGAGIVLTVIGVATIKKTQKPRQRVFASIPLIFAAQQLTEGFLWLALTNPFYAPLQAALTHLFLFFAQIVWPVWVPLGILLLETKTNRKKTERLLTLIGIVVSAFLGYCLLSFEVEANAIGHHIAYKQDYPLALSKYGGLLYILATIAPSFLSGIKNMWSLGTAILISYIVTVIFYQGYILSVWCFFSAVISIAVYAIVYQTKKEFEIKNAAIL